MIHFASCKEQEYTTSIDQVAGAMTGFPSPCGACKFLRRKCVNGCVFAPHFCHEQGAAHFGAIHKVFGASNVSKLLTSLPATDRHEAAATISYEAQARLHDPVYGCVAHIFALQQQVSQFCITVALTPTSTTILLLSEFSFGELLIAWTVITQN